MNVMSGSSLRMNFQRSLRMYSKAENATVKMHLK